MGAILRASNTLWFPGRKPGGALAIDWSHPLSNGLVDYLLFNDDGIPANLATPSAVTGSTSNPASVSTALGPARYCTGGADVNVPNHVNYSAGDFTVRIIVLPVTWPANFTALIDKGSAGRELSFFFDTSGNIDFIVVGTGGGSQSVTTGLTAGSIWDFVALRNSAVDSQNVRVAVNGGNFQTTTSNNLGSTTAAAAALSFGANPSGGGHAADAQYILASIWSRALSDSEISYLYLNPFAMLTTTEGELPELMVPPLQPPLMGQIWI